MPYCDLDSIDIVARHRVSGQRLYVQTDHRTAAEIETSRDMSIVLALMRVLNAIRTGKGEGGRFKVVYAISSDVPDYLHQAIVAAGGVLEIDHRERGYQGDLPAVETLLNSSLADIAADVSRRMNLPLTIEGLSALERAQLQTRPVKEKDHVLYWTTVIVMGAFAGEVQRRLRGGGWVPITDFISTLPVAYSCWTQTVNFFGKAMKYLENGEGDSLAFMVRVVRDNLDREGHTTPAPAPSGGPRLLRKPRPFGHLFGK